MSFNSCLPSVRKTEESVEYKPHHVTPLFPLRVKSKRLLLTHKAQGDLDPQGSVPPPAHSLASNRSQPIPILRPLHAVPPT